MRRSRRRRTCQLLGQRGWRPDELRLLRGPLLAGTRPTGRASRHRARRRYFSFRRRDLGRPRGTGAAEPPALRSRSSTDLAFSWRWVDRLVTNRGHVRIGSAGCARLLWSRCAFGGVLPWSSHAGVGECPGRPGARRQIFRVCACARIAGSSWHVIAVPWRVVTVLVCPSAIAGAARRGTFIVIGTAVVRPCWGRFAIRVNTGICADRTSGQSARHNAGSCTQSQEGAWLAPCVPLDLVEQISGLMIVEPVGKLAYAPRRLLGKVAHRARLVRLRRHGAKLRRPSVQPFGERGLLVARLPAQLRTGLIYQVPGLVLGLLSNIGGLALGDVLHAGRGAGSCVLDIGRLTLGGIDGRA